MKCNTVRMRLKGHKTRLRGGKKEILKNLASTVEIDENIAE